MVLASAVGPGLTGALIDLGVAYETQMLAMAAYCFCVAVSMTAVSVHVRKRLATTAETAIAGHPRSR